MGKIKVSFIPKLSDTLFYISKENKHLFLNQDLPNWLVLNQNSAYIVGLIDGKKSIEEIYQTLTNSNIKVEKDKILYLFRELKQYGIINDEDLIANKQNHRNNNSSHSKLHIVHIQLTNECNLSCKYCFAESGANHENFLSLDELKKIVDDTNKISNNLAFILSGGEPFLYPHTVEFMEYINSLGKQIHLLTNGILITAERAKKIAKLCSFIKISIDGSTEEINSITRGKGSLEGAMRGYKLLISEGANVSISMTVTKKNIFDIPNMVKKFGNRLALQPFFKAGRGIKNADLQITGREYYEALANVDGLKPMGRLGKRLEGIRGRGVTKCAMADGEIAISNNGDVFPCQMLMDDEFKGGNIRQDTIEEIINSKTFKKVSSFSSLENEDCMVCPIKLMCGGACRARSYLETGSLFKNSDFCDYEKLAYINGIFEVSEF